MNLSQLRSRVRSLTGIRMESLRSDSDIDAVINEAYQEVINLANWPFLRSEQSVTLAAEDNEFSTPAGFSEVNSVFYLSDDSIQTKLSPTSIEEIDRLDPNNIEQPVFYARINQNDFVVWPKPKSQTVMTVRGKLQASSLSSNSSQPLFDESFHPILSYRTASKILAEEGDDSGRAELYQQESVAIFQSMQQFYLRATDTPLIVMGSSQRRRGLDAYQGKPAGRL